MYVHAFAKAFCMFNANKVYTAHTSLVIIALASNEGASEHSLFVKYAHQCLAIKLR